MKQTLPCRHLLLVLGDQLNEDSALWEQADRTRDCVWMAEVLGESTEPLSSKQRTLLFLSAMRLFSQRLQDQGWRVDYRFLHERLADLGEALQQAIARHRPQAVYAVLPGDNRVRQLMEAAAGAAKLTLNWLPDRHFMAEPGEFSHWLAGKKQPRMEYWYRYLRRKHGILLRADGQPEGGVWNFDKDNRQAFGKQGPGALPPLESLEDAASGKVMNAVRAEIEAHLPGLPGFWGDFLWPLTREQALAQWQDFVQTRLPLFGDFQDAMWLGEDTLYHSRISAALNLKLLNPRELIADAENAYRQGCAPLNAVEGFIRQILGWREYVRGLYWSHRNAWADMNALQAAAPLPEVYWHGKTDYVCLHEALRPVLHEGYGHHIQRLMVTGLFALLRGVEPQAVHRWYLAMYADAVAWVEIPNTLGMSQFADGGIVGSKPYIASGAYIQRMSNYCARCRYRPEQASGEQACPFTALYWDFIARHENWLQGHPRLGMQVKNWQAKSAEQQAAIRETAKRLMEEY
ncbi:cryptochrome/photolyase family protein [Thiomicrorhabdus cannonii]|uniref:cryptochrome/photolyase family protein n=1 Tax=Thiomicrorhabdus cannonii TaxID=2748011 RepID=UPI0015BCD47D|nr:cryptochrome/photolyase family protein [Thiomicrorhabdus cannonii]